MGRLLRGIGWLLLGLAGLAAITGLVARLSDGPIGPFPDGPLARGELVQGHEPDWTFAAEIPQIEIQMNRVQPLSRTVWLLVDQGELFVPAALGRKYGMTPGPEGSDDTWFFHLGPRPAS